MLILKCPICHSTMQVLAKTKEGELGFRCYNEMCPSYNNVIPIKEITEECIEQRAYINNDK